MRGFCVDLPNCRTFAWFN